MTEVIDHGHSFISHPGTMVPTYGAGREHRGHRVLIPEKSGLRGQSRSNPVQRDYRWKFISVNPARHRSRSGEAGGSGSSSDCKERARETHDGSKI